MPRFRRTTDDPLDLLRLAIGALLLSATVVALVLALTGVEPRALELALVCWGLYGFLLAVVNGVLEPVIDGFARMLMDVGLGGGEGYSAIEARVARGEYAEAAEEYAERARIRRERVDATLRRAALLAGPLSQVETAAVELDALRADGRLSAPDDIRVGVALADLYEFRFADPGRAMVELRRLIDRYPDGRAARQLRRTLAALKAERFGDAASTLPRAFR